jgi:hypothetical protein
VRPVAPITSAPTIGLQRVAEAGAMTPLATIDAGPSGVPTGSTADAPPVELRRLPSAADATLAAGSRATVQTLAAVQRLEAGSTSTTSATAAAPSLATSAVASAPSPNGSSDGPSAASAEALPLHTAAAAIPSASDIAVKAGLAERGPNGDLLYTSPPGGGESSFSVQRLEDGSDGGSEAAVQRAWTTATPSATARNANQPTIGSHRAVTTSGVEESGSGKGHDPAADAKSKAEEARQLYPYIRSALEADLRRQLEGKSRASRFRP